MPIHKNVNTDFFKSWSPEMSYILGYFAADGSMIKTNRGTHFIEFCGADKEILKEIRETMKAEHKFSERKTKTGVVYRFQIGSKEMYSDLVKLGFTQYKSRRLLMPDIPDTFFPHFVRGYFDGDGNVWSGFVNRNRKTMSKVIQVAFTSGSRIFLELLWERLQAIGIKGGSLYHAKVKHFSRLSFSTHDALKLFEIMYNGQPKLYLKRKKLRFDQFRSDNCVKTA